MRSLVGESRPGNGGRSRRWIVCCLLLLLGFATAPGPPVQAQELALELTPQVRQQLRALQDAWQGWSTAFFQNDRAAADASLEQLKAIGKFLEMPRLGDLSVAAATCAVIAAKEGDFERARWAMQASRRLDRGRPETEFAEAEILRIQGNFPGALMAGFRGYRALLELPIAGQVWLNNLGVWFAYLLVLSGVLFVLVQMAGKGGAVFYDLVRMVSPPMAPLVADLLVVAVLMWPIFLPSGLLWLLLYWSVLLWSYGSITERGIFFMFWLLLGCIPLFLSFQQRSVELASIPPNRLMANLENDRLYGELFDDLRVMQLLWADSLTVQEITADLHRRFGQWEQARAIYSALSENPDVQPEDRLAAYNNIGVYFLRNQDANSALDYFERALEVGRSPEVLYNIGQTYSQLFDFSKGNEFMTRARRLDEKRVEAWNNSRRAVEESGVAIDGGLRRAPALQEELRELWEGSTDAGILRWLRRLSLPVVLLLTVLAVSLRMVREQIGYRSKTLEEKASPPRPVRILVPGLASSLEGYGIRALLGILLVVGAALLPMIRELGYRTALAWDAGNLLPTVSSILLLGLVFLGRTIYDFVVES